MKFYSLKGILLGSLSAMSLMVTAQWKEYDPQQYKLPGKIDYPLAGYVNPEYHYRELNAVFHLTGSYDNSVEKSLQKITANGFNLSPDAAFSGYSVHNSATLQQNTTWQASVGMRVENSQNSIEGLDQQTDQSTVGSNLSYRTEALYYRGKRYVGVGVATGINYQASHYQYEQTGTTNQLDATDNRNFSVNLAPRFTLGWGRIEQTDNAWQAVQLIRSLQRANRLAVVPSEEVITRLADRITLLRNRRAFDHRLKTIADLVELDSTLSAFTLVAKGDVVSFAAVNDIWSYAPHPDRAAGSRWYAGIESSVSWHHRFDRHKVVNPVAGNVNEERTREYNTQNYRLVAGFLCGKPLSMEWQRTMIVELKGGYENNYNTADAGTRLAPSVSLQSALEYGFFPDTRTSLTTGFSGFFNLTSVEYIQTDPAYSDGAGFDSERLAANLRAYSRYSYYLSPSLSLSIQTEVFYNLFQTDNGAETAVFSLKPGLNYNKRFGLDASGTLVYRIR